jgi:hypothetical protein
MPLTMLKLRIILQKFPAMNVKTNYSHFFCPDSKMQGGCPNPIVQVVLGISLLSIFHFGKWSVRRVYSQHQEELDYEKGYYY